MGLLEKSGVSELNLEGTLLIKEETRKMIPMTDTRIL